MRRSLGSTLLCLSAGALETLGREIVSQCVFTKPECDDLDASAATLLLQAKVALDAGQPVNSTTIAAAPSPYWAGKNGDLLRTGYSPFSGPWNLAAGSNWSWTPLVTNSPNWNGNYSGRVAATPLIDAEMNVYFTVCKPPEVRKYSKTGQLLWSHKEPSGDGVASIPGVPVILESNIFFSTTFGEVIALDLNSGTEQWRERAGSFAGSDTFSLTAGFGLVIAPVTDLVLPTGGNNRVVALDAKTGQIVWHYSPDFLVYNFLSAIDAGALLFADALGVPYKLNLTTGSLIWKGNRSPVADFSTGGAIVGPNNVMYVTGNYKEVREFELGGGYIAAFSTIDGKLLWFQRTVDGLAANNAAALGPLWPDGGLGLVIGTGPNPDMPVPGMNHPPKPRKVQALDASNGQLIWAYDMSDFLDGVAAGDATRPTWTICLPDSWSNAAIGADGWSYLGNEDGRIYSVKDINGDGHIDDNQGEVSFLDTGFAFQGSPAISPGLVAIASCGSFHVFLT